jgi:SAM-dependent methyltransferase
MLPAIAAHAITHLSQPGDLVLDPMCGIGTTLIEAVHLGRDAIGVEYEPSWAGLARANLTHAARQGATGHGRVVTDDARHLTELLDSDVAGRVALVVTSPPYGPSTHGHVRTSRDSGQPGVAKANHRYSRDRANLAHVGLDRLLDGFTTILAQCAALLRPGGFVVVTTRPWRHRGELVDLPSAVVEAGAAAGLVPMERCVALLAGLRGHSLVARPSFFQLRNVRQARAAGVPQHVIVHEDVLIFLRPAFPRSSPEPKGSQSELKGPARRCSHAEPAIAAELGTAA